MMSTIMKRRLTVALASAAVLLAVFPAFPAFAIEEPDRLWLVGQQAAADGLNLLARRELERLVAQYPGDARVGEATLLLGKTRLALGDLEAAADAFHRAQTLTPVPGRPLEAKFWEAETLFRLKHLPEALGLYDEIVRADAASPFAADALYGYAFTELELKRPEPAATAFRDFLTTWPDHPQASSARFNLARTLVELKRFAEAIPVLEDFRAKYPNDKLLPDAQYLLGWARVGAGEARAGVDDLRAFVTAYPNHELVPAAKLLMSRTLVGEGGRAGMEDAYQALMTETPPTAENLWEAASVAARLGRPADQEAAWRKLRQEFPDHALGRRASLELASLAYKRKDWKGAVWLAHLAGQSDEDAVKSEGWLLAGESELKLKRFDAAEKAFETALGVAGITAAVRFRALAGLGLAHEEQREWREALTAYESVASKSPDTTLREWARDRAAAVKKELAKSGGGRKPRSGT
jgi:TolA-binding protein